MLFNFVLRHDVIPSLLHSHGRFSCFAHGPLLDQTSSHSVRSNQPVSACVNTCNVLFFVIVTGCRRQDLQQFGHIRTGQDLSILFSQPIVSYCTYLDIGHAGT